jgi:thiosulfate/3-mercaptopyruvate sulfurtransferase
MTMTTASVLASTAEIAGRIRETGLRILDVDEDTDAFGRDHLEGAQGIHWKNDLQDPIRRDFIGPEAFASLMDRLGVGNDDDVVLYGGTNNWFAAYAFWYFRYYGHPSVRLMDGGRKKWEIEGRPMSAEPTRPAPTRGYRVRAEDDSIRALRAFIEGSVVGNPAFGLVDVKGR